MATIYVGVDGSDCAALALRWAGEEGRARGLPVVAVMAWGYLDQRHAVSDQGFDPAYSEETARSALAAFVAAADLTGVVEERVVNDLAPNALLGLAGPDDLIVVGARGLGGFKGLLLGSVSQRIVAESPCPVVVVRDGGQPQGPVVVGVDGSQNARRALEWAVAEARARGVGLLVVHGWTAPFVGGYAFAAVSFDHRLVEEGARAMVEEVVADVDTSGVPLEIRVTQGSGAGVVLDHASDASLVVVGSRGLTGFTRWLLGSVSHQVVLHAPGTAVVVPHQD